MKQKKGGTVMLPFETDVNDLGTEVGLIDSTFEIYDDVQFQTCSSSQFESTSKLPIHQSSR